MYERYNITSMNTLGEVIDQISFTKQGQNELMKDI